MQLIQHLVRSCKPFGGNTTTAGILARSSGQILNPNTELLFNGVKLRSFNFTFNLAPRSDDEARVIQQIVRTFKLNMAPNTGGGSGTRWIIFKITECIPTSIYEGCTTTSILKQICCCRTYKYAGKLHRFGNLHDIS